MERKNREVIGKTRESTLFPYYTRKVKGAFSTSGAYFIVPYTFTHRNPGLVRIDPRCSKIAQGRAPLRDNHPFRGADYLQGVRIDLSKEQGCPVAEYVVIIRAPSRIDQKEAFRVRYPMLLGIVRAEFGPVVKAPGADGIKVKPVRA